MKEFLILTIAFIFFLLLRVAKNRLSASQKLIISLVFVSVLAFGIISRPSHFNWSFLIILSVIVILVFLRYLNFLRNRD